MKLKMLETVHRHQTGSVVMTNFGTFKFRQVGDEIDMPDEAGYEILGKHPRKFEKVSAESAPSVKAQEAPETKMSKAPANKALGSMEF